MDTNAVLRQPFMPHGMCYLWNPQMLWLQIASDASIALAYFSIPILLLYFIRKRRDIPFSGTIAMFGLFIVACGLTHVMGIWTIYYPSFWLDGGIKAVTAAVSLATAVMLVPLLPKALTLRTPAQLERLNERLAEDLRLRREALAESERRYTALADAMPQIVFTADSHGSLDYLNGRWVDYTGKTLEDGLGSGWQSALHPDDVAPTLARWASSVTAGAEYEIEYRFRRARDASYRWHLVRALPIHDGTGEITKWFGTCTDIDDQKLASEAAGRWNEQLRLNERLETDIRSRKAAEAALRASEERFRQVEEYSPIGLALVALDGRFLRVNSALCILTGYSPEELLETTFAAITHPDDIAADLARVEDAIAGSIASFKAEKRYVMRDGRSVWVLLNCSMVSDEAGRPSYFIRQTQDITDRKAIERAALSTQEAALATAAAKSRFLATMSHEIRTPMNGIIGMAELLSFSSLSVEQGEYVAVIRDSGKSLLRVLNDILDYSKIEAGKLEVESVEFDVGSQIASVVSLLAPQSAAKNIALTFEIDSDIAPVVKGDAGRIRQILLNLVGNALKFTPAGGSVCVRAAAGQPNAASAWVRFTVTDSGAGISAEAQERLFQPFSQLDQSTTRKYGGTGLGLSISKQLVEFMHGEIGVESSIGTGSTFWFTLPFEPGDEARPMLRATVEADGRSLKPLRTERLLLAEDNEVNTLLAIKQFRLLGFDVSVVPNGREAVEAVKHQHFEAVFMDCHMPEMDGLDATREIRRLPFDRQRRIPIIAMTADAQAEDKAACLSAGMDDYISKPATVSDLRTMLERWLPSEQDAAVTGSGRETSRTVPPRD